METSRFEESLAVESWAVAHPVSAEDAAIVAATREMVLPMRGMLQGTGARQPFDEIMGHVSAPEGVTYEAGTVGGVAGWWCRPQQVGVNGTILYLHGGWFAWGSALAYRHLAGHVAVRAGAPVFVPDYRLAPEHPFPAGLLDAKACYYGLIDLGLGPVAIVGDSAGGALSLGVSVLLVGEGATPVGVVALSPVTDLTLSGSSWETRAVADPFFTVSQAVGLVGLYLGGHDPKDPLASPLFGGLAGMPPVRVHVGDDEMLLEDSRRYVERAVAAGVDARVDIWEGMPHVFPSSAGRLKAADAALDAIGEFLASRLG